MGQIPPAGGAEFFIRSMSQDTIPHSWANFKGKKLSKFDISYNLQQIWDSMQMFPSEEEIRGLKSEFRDIIHWRVVSPHSPNLCIGQNWAFLENPFDFWEGVRVEVENYLMSYMSVGEVSLYFLGGDPIELVPIDPWST